MRVSHKLVVVFAVLTLTAVAVFAVPQSSSAQICTPRRCPTTTTTRATTTTSTTAATTTTTTTTGGARTLLVPSSTYPSVDTAMTVARAGDTIQLSGQITGPVTITKNGVTLTGPATITSTGYGVTAVGVTDVTVRGLTIKGKKGVYVRGAQRWRITGNVISASDECVRIKDRSTDNVIESNTIGPCRGGDTGTNGEGVYIGTSSTQTATPDQSDRNVVRGNVIGGPTTWLWGECVDVKEGAADNVVADNRCTGSLEEATGGLQSRGIRTQFLRNISTGNSGAGIRLGSSDPASTVDGGGTVMIGNDLRGNSGASVKLKTAATQGVWCENRADSSDPAGLLAQVTRPC